MYKHIVKPVNKPYLKGGGSKLWILLTFKCRKKTKENNEFDFHVYKMITVRDNVITWQR